MEDPTETIISCPICLEVYESPRMLPCQHTFCEKCLTSHMKKVRLTGRCRKVGCPLCRKSFVSEQEPFDGTTFPLNRLILEITDIRNLKTEDSKTSIKKSQKRAKAVRCSVHKDVEAESICTSHSRLFCKHCPQRCNSIKEQFQNMLDGKSRCHVTTLVKYVLSPEYKRLKSAVLESSCAVVDLYDTIQKQIDNALAENKRNEQKALVQTTTFRDDSIKHIKKMESDMTNQIHDAANNMKDLQRGRRKTCEGLKPNIMKLRQKTTNDSDEFVETKSRHRILSNVLLPLKALATQGKRSYLKLEIPNSLNISLVERHDRVCVKTILEDVNDSKMDSRLAIIKPLEQYLVLNESPTRQYSYGMDIGAQPDVDNIDGMMYVSLLDDLGTVEKFVVKSLMSPTVSLKYKLLGSALFAFFARLYILSVKWHPLVAMTLVVAFVCSIVLKPLPRQVRRFTPTYICFCLLDHISLVATVFIIMYLIFLLYIKYVGPEVFSPNIRGYSLNLDGCTFEETMLACLFGEHEVLALKLLIGDYHRRLIQPNLS